MDIQAVLNQLAMDWDPSTFLASLSSAPTNPSTQGIVPSPRDEELEPGFGDTIFGDTPASSADQKAALAGKKKSSGLSPTDVAAISALMPKQVSWPPAPAAGPRAGMQVQLPGVLNPQVQRSPLVPSFAQLLGR